MKITLVERLSKKTGNKYFAWKVEFVYEGQSMCRYYPFIENDLFLSQLYKKESVKEFD